MRSEAWPCQDLAGAENLLGSPTLLTEERTEGLLETGGVRDCQRLQNAIRVGQAEGALPRDRPKTEVMAPHRLACLWGTRPAPAWERSSRTGLKVSVV